MNDKQVKSLYVLGGMGVGFAAASQGSLAILSLGAIIALIAAVGIVLADNGKK